MPRRSRCWNFNNNGTRKTWPNGDERACRPDCLFIHPSEPEWDRAPPAPARAGAPPPGGRGRGQSSFGAPASGANTTSLGPERGSLSAPWEDFMTGFGSTRAASSHHSGWSTSGSSRWGDTNAGDPGWGSGANNDASASDGWSNGPSAWGDQASSQLDTHTEGWGSGWGSTISDLGTGWGGDSTKSHTTETPSAATVARGPGPAGPDSPMERTWTDDNADMATTATSSSRTVPSISSPSEPDATHGEQNGDNAAVDRSPLERKASPSAMTLRLSSASKPIKTRSIRNDRDRHSGPRSSGANKMSNLTLYTAMALKMRELDVELSQLSLLRKSSQVATTKAAKDLLRNKVHRFTDARDALEEEHKDCARDLMEIDSLYFPFVHYTSTTLGHDDEQLKQVKDWILGAERYLNQIQAENSPISSVKSNGVAYIYKLTQLKQRSDSLAENGSPCQDLQDYNALLDHQIQKKKELIIEAMIKGQDITHNYLLSMSLSTLQRQGEVWNQTLQVHSKGLAEALLQSNQLKEDRRSRSIIKEKKKGSIQQLQVNISQRRLQLQALQEEISQLQDILMPLKQQQQDVEIINPYGYIPYFQEYIKEYIQTSVISYIKALGNPDTQFGASGSETVKEVWKALQPLLQMSVWLQDSDIYKIEEEIEIREIESLIA